MNDPLLPAVWRRLPPLVLAATLVILLVVPFLSLALSSSPAAIWAGINDPGFASALWVSVRTTSVSLLFIVTTGTPLAWWFATHRSRWARAAAVIVDLPIVVPPAVIGIALLETFGRRGMLGPLLETLGVSLSFTSAAVSIAQVVVAAPFYVQTATTAFRRVDLDLLVVARTLGASPRFAFFRVAVPIAFPGLLGGVALAWARALGEFGATLLFAGNFAGVTRTMPLAIYSALEADLRVALAIALVLTAVGTLLLVVLRAGPSDAGTDLRRRRPSRTSATASAQGRAKP